VTTGGAAVTEVLRDEHRLILRALVTLENAAGRLEAGHALPEGLWAGIIDWLRGFADRTHHAKEERALFPAMLKAGVPSGGGPIDVMLEEHAQGRALLGAMETGTPGARAAAARRYVALLCDHIDKENGLLFPLADVLLDERAQAEVGRGLAALAAERGEATDLASAAEAAARLAAALGA
jgi:hemerythrin-like domain-containing protein